MPRHIDQNGVTDALLIISILKQIPTSRWISGPQIQQNLSELGIEIEARRMQRLLKSIRDCEQLHVDVNDKSKPFGYRRQVPETDLAVDQLKPAETLLFRLFEEHMQYQLPAPLLKSLSPFFAAAKSSLNETKNGRTHEWLRKVAFVSGTVPMMRPRILPRVFDAVSEALYRDAKLKISFENRKGEKSKAEVSPLGLVQQEQRLYLVCRFENYDNVRHLALHRITYAEVLDFPAERPKDFSLERYIRDRHFNYSNGGRIRLEIEFTNPETARNMSETPFNSTQVLTELPDGAWRLEAVMDDTVVLQGWIAAWHDIAGMRLVKKTPVETPVKD